MAEDQRIVKRLHRIDSVANLKMVNNYCLVKMMASNVDKPTKDGIVLATEFLNRNQYLDDYVTRVGTIVKVPESLSLFSKKNPKGSWWLTEIEVEEGDFVWVSYGSVLDVDVLVCEGEEYCLIPYQDLRLARKRDGSYMLLNGWVLYKDVEEDQPDTSIINPETREHIDLNKGRVVLTGNPNKLYYETDKVTKQVRWVDLDADKDVKLGDVIVKYNPSHHLILENPLFAEYPEKEVYLIQRRNIIAVLQHDSAVSA
jgi:hypothetical protein